jgi:pentose-5-phosphate-3-epimerase
MSFKDLTTILRVFIVELLSKCTTVLVDCHPIDRSFPVIHNVKALAEKKEDMEKLLKKLKEESEKAGLSLNLKKTKIMTTGTLNEFILNGTEIEITSYHMDPCIEV